MEEVVFLKSEECVFYENAAGLIMLKYKGADVGRVAVLRMFPLQCEDGFLSVRRESYSADDCENEIGIIRTLDEFSREQRAIIEKELAARYFIPQITAVESVKEEFGNTVWETQTTAGRCGFTVKDMGTNVCNHSGRVILTDVYGARYEIPDVTKIGDKALRVLEVWL